MDNSRDVIYVAGIRHASAPMYASRDLAVVMALVGKEYRAAHGPIQWTQNLVDGEFFRWTALVKDGEDTADWYIERLSLDTSSDYLT